MFLKAKLGKATSGSGSGKVTNGSGNGKAMSGNEPEPLTSRVILFSGGELPVSQTTIGYDVDLAIFPHVPFQGSVSTDNVPEAALIICFVNVFLYALWSSAVHDRCTTHNGNVFLYGRVVSKGALHGFVLVAFTLHSACKGCVKICMFPTFIQWFQSDLTKSTKWCVKPHMACLGTLFLRIRAWFRGSRLEPSFLNRYLRRTQNHV